MKNSSNSFKKSLSFILCVVALLLFSLEQAQSEPKGKSENASCKVGIYDSRAIAMAYYRSETFAEYISGQHALLKAAQEEGNESAIHELGEKGKSIQAKAHQQGFGTAPVDEIIRKIRDKLPEISKKADVGLIISKWKIDYLAPNAEYTDITDLMVQPFSPSPETLKVIKDIQKKDPIPLAELKEHEH